VTIHVVPIPSTIELTAPAFSLGTTNIAGDTGLAVDSNSTLLVFDATVPVAVGASAAGSAVLPARRDHVHTTAGTTVDNTIARYDGTAGAMQAYTSGGPVITDTGDITASAQPSVGASGASGQSNVTGDNTIYTCTWDEIWDIGGNFASNTFTAPTSGKYLVSALVNADGIGSAPQIGVYVVTSLRTWYAYVTDQSANNVTVVDMDASDQMTIALQVNGTGSKTVDVLGGSTRTALTIWKVG